ncbi:cytochrome P450 [Sphingobium sp. Sx8-8]|uniref:cytochrome P450 n=1 Tax=Sphingobium sp. Sx8-8 TaxID=2933617 RepID=UPI001F587563|nr:cytochrome P450 [Sphingobium sp. Sx8-8]
MNAIAVPSHVPFDRVLDFDMIADVAKGGLQDAHRALHDKAPDVFFTPRNGGHWVATRMADITEIMTNPEVFSSADALPPMPWYMPKMKLPPQDMDPPQHMRYRLLLLKFLAPREVKKLETRIRALMTELIDAALAKGSVDFVADVAVPFPVKIFMGMMGMDMSRFRQFVGWANAALASAKPRDRVMPFIRINLYMRSLIKQRKKHPGDDVVSMLIASEVEGKKLSDGMILQICNLLFLAGLDTVTNGMTFILRHLAEHPDQQQRLRDNSDEIPGAIEEMLRRYAFVTVIRRVTRDTVLNGAALHAGDIIYGSLAGASNDERVFPDPGTVDLDRPRPSHVAFNTGPHNCAGANLARLELKVFLEEWLRRVPPFRLKPGQHLETRGGAILAIEQLQVVW